LHDHGLVALLLLLFLLVVFGGLAALVGVVLSAARKQQQRATDAFQAWALHSGWQLYVGDVPTPWRDRLSHLRRFYIRRLVRGTARGLAVAAADCGYEEQGVVVDGVQQTNHRDLAVFTALLPGMWPDIEVRPRGLGSRIMRSLGVRAAIDTGYPAFDQRFLVEVHDPSVVPALLSPGLVDAHVRGQAPPWSIRGGELLITEDVELTPELIGPGIDRLLWLAAMLGHRG
jgi:hypothetical protein